jgi:hypothetical protein
VFIRESLRKCALKYLGIKENEVSSIPSGFKNNIYYVEREKKRANGEKCDQ